MKNLKTYTINLSNIKLVTNKILCLSLLPSDIPLMAAKKSRYPILRSMFWVVIPIFQNQAVFIFPQNVFSLFFGENVGCLKVESLKSKAILSFISSAKIGDKLQSSQKVACSQFLFIFFVSFMKKGSSKSYKNVKIVPFIFLVFECVQN